MTKSMTAFSRQESGAAVWEIRSVNHRYLDISFRVPDNLKHLEPELKLKFKNVIHRGKLECVLKINTSELKSQISINENLIRELNTAMETVTEITGISEKGDILSFLRWPDVLVAKSSDADLIREAKNGFKLAISQLLEMRNREGEELEKLLESRLVEIDLTLEQLREQAPIIMEHQYQKLKKRLGELNIKVEPGRLEQELLILAQKLDVAEELDRLATHVTEVRRSLRKNEPTGRRLDFLMQELNREANTLSSKATAASTTMHAVELKVLIEQMREQIQNIE